MRQQRGRTIRRRTRRRPTHRFLGRLRRSADRGVISRIQLGTAGRSPRLRRWALAVVLLGVALVTVVIGIFFTQWSHPVAAPAEQPQAGLRVTPLLGPGGAALLGTF